MEEIGGYFELELRKGKEYHQNAIRLNTGRNAFEYILRAKSYTKVYLPYYTCDVMLEPINKLNLKYDFYPIDSTFNPIFDFSLIKENDVFVYTNYFGICDGQVKIISKKCKNLIIDNSQAFYSKPLPGIDTFYSARKFFGVPDGAYLSINKELEDDIKQDYSYDRCEHLLGRIDLGAEKFYGSFKRNESLLKGQPIKLMSKLTQRLLESIDYDEIAKKRQNNFNYLHSVLKKDNKLNIKLDLEKETVPMIYPFLIDNGQELKKKLIENKIFVATYWPNVFGWTDKDSFEYKLTKHLLPLPIDQRYEKNELNIIVKHLKKNLL